MHRARWLRRAKVLSGGGRAGGRLRPQRGQRTRRVRDGGDSVEGRGGEREAWSRGMESGRRAVARCASTGCLSVNWSCTFY